MTENTDPEINTSTTLFLCDSNTVKYENVTGTDVIWDYSNILGVDTDADGQAEAKTLGVYATDPQTIDSLFPGATKKYSINDQIVVYYKTSSVSRISNGFKFTEPSLGDVFTFWDTIPQLMNTYPFDLGSSCSDTMSGRIFSENPGASVDTFAVGRSYAGIDGVGSLKLGSANYTNTFRFHFQDTIYTYVNVDLNGFILNAPVTLYRDVYEYYNYSLSQLPLLVIYSVNNSLFDVPNTIVLSRELPQNNVGIDDELLAENLTIVPNPVNDLLNVELTSGTKAVITDQYGKFIAEVQSSGTVDVSNYKKGMYFVVITGNNGTVTVKKLMKN
jgi:hypothetical protein